MSAQEEIAELQRLQVADVERERVIRDAAFLNAPGFALIEDIAGFPAAPLTLYDCNILRMMGSPFMPPFATPGPIELAGFLWIVNPDYLPGKSPEALRRREKFFATCRVFVKPTEPIFGLTYRIKRWERRAGEALEIFTRTVAAAREYMMEALQDRPPADEGGNGPDYYSDFCHVAAALMRNYPGLDYDRIQRLPTKIIYQFLKEIREHNALSAGQPVILWNQSDNRFDRILEILNTRN
jgi:hypothetical protein